MRISDWAVLILFFGFFVVTVVPMGRFMVKVIKGEPHILSPISAPVEHWILTWSQVKVKDEMDWKTFAIAMMVFSFFGYCSCSSSSLTHRSCHSIPRTGQDRHHGILVSIPQ